MKSNKTHSIKAGSEGPASWYNKLLPSKIKHTQTVPNSMKNEGFIKDEKCRSITYSGDLRHSLSSFFKLQFFANILCFPPPTFLLPLESLLLFHNFLSTVPKSH